MFQDLWRKAIKQQILLLRMDKENQRIVGRYLFNAFKFCPFFDKQTLKNHLNAIHLNIKPFQCDTCDFKATQKGTVKSHVKRNHKK